MIFRPIGWTDGSGGASAAPGPPLSSAFGDTDVDVEGARNAGIPHVFCSYGYSTLGPDELGVEIAIDEFSELLDVLRTLD